MTDFRNITTQEDLENLFRCTNFANDCSWGKGLPEIEEPDEDGFQFIHIGECEYIGSLMSGDCENSGEDALMVQTLLQMFRDGKLRVV